MLVLQRFLRISDEATDEQIFDRTSFKNHLGLRLGARGSYRRSFIG